MQKIDVQQIETITDRKSLERLLNDWKIEKLSSDRSRLQEKEREKMRKLLELQRKMSEFDSEDSEEQEVVTDDLESVPDHFDEEDREEEHQRLDIQEGSPEKIADDKWHVNSEFVDASPTKESSSADGFDRSSSDIGEYLSNPESEDLTDEFDEIDARIQKRLEESLKKNVNLTVSDLMDASSSDKSSMMSDEPVKEPIKDNDLNDLGEEPIKDNDLHDFGEGPSTQKEVDNQPKELTNQTMTTEEIQTADISLVVDIEPTPEVIDSSQQLSKSEAKKIMKEIDNNVRQSLEELEQMEEQLQDKDDQQNNETTVEPSESPKESFESPKEVRKSMIFDENFEWARTEYECELCCGVYSIEDLVSMIACTHFACRECLQKYFAVQIREQQRLVICCPFCEEPAISPDDDDKVFEYLGLLDQIIKYLVPTDIYELFQRKLRDRALMRDPNFLWCSEV